MIDIPYSVTVFSIFLQFNKMETNVMKVGFHYFDDVRKSIVPGNQLPDDCYLNNPSDLSVVARKSYFDKAVFSINGSFDQL